jgi:spore coat polysaccharide biosynthesis protein SpsF
MVVGGQKYLAHQIDRVLQKCPLNRCFIATTKGTEDDLICEIALEASGGCYSSNSEDVLNRYIEAAQHYDFKNVVRITGDCPLIDPYIMDLVIGVY